MKKTRIAWTRVENSGKKKEGKVRREKKPPGTSLSLGNTAKVTKNMLPARATEKSWLKKSQIEHEFYLVQRPYSLDVFERAYENKKRGGFVHLKRRLGGRGVFFSRVALILSHCARSRALSNCQKEKRRRKETQTNKQPTTKTKKKKNVCGQATWIMAILAIFSSFCFTWR